MQGDNYIMMIGNRLYKSEKLCSRTAINEIFSDGGSIIAYPLRAAYRFTDSIPSNSQFLITIPKKKIRTAVGRVLLRRRTREAYRLNRNILLPELNAYNKSLEVAFIYLGKEIVDYETINAKMVVLLSRLAIIAGETPKIEK